MKNPITTLTLFIIVCICFLSISCDNSNEVTLSERISTTDPNPPVLDTGPLPGLDILVFHDYFDNNASFDNWEKAQRNDYNSALCMYDSTVPYVGTFDGKSVLVLTATKTNNTYKSGHVKSEFSFTPAINEEYRVKASIKLIAVEYNIPVIGNPVPLRLDPNVDPHPKSIYTYINFDSTYGAWPAFWTTDESVWPTRGEIDIMEGYSMGAPGQERFASNLFYGTAVGANLLQNNVAERAYLSSTANGWHTYEAYWKNDNGIVSVRIRIDGVDLTTYTNVIDADLALENFSRHNIILNLNVGSDDDPNGNPTIFDNSLIDLFDKTYMLVDYVTVTKKLL